MYSVLFYPTQLHLIDACSFVTPTLQLGTFICGFIVHNFYCMQKREKTTEHYEQRK